MLYHCKSLALSLAAVALLLAGAIRSPADDMAVAKQILDVAGVPTGLCVHLGCGRTGAGGLTAELAAGSRMLVHGIAGDDAAADRARRAVAARGVAGQALVERLPVAALPHVSDLANLVVIEDFDALAEAGLKMSEVERILAPGGVICQNTGGKWIRTVKSRPVEMDEWTHPQHGPDGNMVSNDRLARFPVGLRWQDGVPLNFNMWAACRGWVLAGGRCFTLSTTEVENLGPACVTKPKADEYVLARDAYNGLPLWKVNCETTNDGKWLNAWNASPIVSDGQRVFVYKKDRVVALDGATGAVVVSYPVKYQSARLLLNDNVLVAAGWEARDWARDGGRPELWAPWVSKTSVGAIEAFDAASGKPLWSVPAPAVQILSADGAVYALIQAGNPATAAEIQAVDVRTGRPRWRVAHTVFAPELGAHLCNAGLGVLIVGRPKAKTISILSAETGKLAWEIPGTTNLFTPLVDGRLWNGNKIYDPRTGEVKGQLPMGISSGGCTPDVVIAGSYVTASRGGAYIAFASADEGRKMTASRIHYGAVRGACIEGATPANGMLYTAQNFCRCSPGQVPGFVAFGPSGDPPAEADFEKARPLEKGPAFGAVKEGRARPGDWPAYRRDVQRSAATPVAVPVQLKPAWHTDVAAPAAGPLAAAWQARLGSCLTAPVVADGLAFVGAVEAGEVAAFDAATGKPVWRANLGGRIDTPPTIYQGLCLLGSHDGWVYALRAADGQLAWRLRVAPRERRMVAFGAVESVWPALGSVLVHGGLLYASAGRTTESDGGVALCALKPATGEQVWARQVGPGPLRQNDLLMLRDGKLTMHHVQIDPQTGRHEYDPKQARAAGSLEGLIDGTWTRLGDRRSGRLTFGRAVAEMLAWNDETVFGYEGRARTLFAMERTKTTGTEKISPKDFVWRAGLPANQQAEAMVLGKNALLLAGRTWDAAGEKVSGLLLAVSLADGKRLWELPLDAPPVYDGVALVDGGVFVTLQNGKLVRFEESDV